MIISQSGETAETLAILRDTQKQGVKVLAIVNVPDSSMAREADAVLYTLAGPEIAIASTKAYLAQVLTMYLIGLFLADMRAALEPAVMDEMLNELVALPEKVELFLKGASRVEAVAKSIMGLPTPLFWDEALIPCGREGTLKLKETTYIHAESYPAGELKHGPLALIEEGVLVITLVTQDDLQDRMKSSIEVLKIAKAQ